MHPATRGRFLEARPTPLQRLYYEAGDGWRAPLYHLPACPGGSGEPVLLVHGLGIGADAFRYGPTTLAGALRRAGYAVYVMSHRADAEAIPPTRRARASIDFDEILERDLPAAADRVVCHADMPRLHLVGHALGGQLGLCWAASAPDTLATVVALAAPMTFDGGVSGARRLSHALSLLPARFRLPLRAACRLATPWLDEGALARVTGADDAPGARMRGVLTHATEDLPLTLLRQVLSWQVEGALTSRDGAFDWSEALVDARVPLLALCGSEDLVCPPDAARHVVACWGDAADFTQVEGLGHVDLLLSNRAADKVFAPLVAWLEPHRRRAWMSSVVDASIVAVAG